MNDPAQADNSQTILGQKENLKVDGIFVKKRNGRLDPLNLNKINRCAARACDGLEAVSASEIVLDAHMQLYNKVPTADIDKALILSARSKIEKEPNYAFAAARILANSIYKEVFGEGVDHDGFELQYKKAFIVNLKKLVRNDRIDKRLLDFDLKKLADAIDVSRDLKFKYLGLQTLYDRYFIHLDGRRLETPQAFWMRVAMGLSINEPDKEDAAIRFYNVMSQFLYCPSTPTLFNSGTCHPQLSSCYLSTLDDSIDGIFGLIHGQARLSKFAGGLGMDVTPIRAALSYIKGTNGKSNGLIPWVKIINDMLVAVNQCFAPDTMVFAANGPTAIGDLQVGDLVLTSKGEYRRVNEVMRYHQSDPMVRIDVKHSIVPVEVTAGHPVMALVGARKGNTNSRTMRQINAGKLKLDWVEAGNLTEGDYVAQPVPQEIVFDNTITEDDCYLYGLMLGDGHITGNQYEAGISLHTTDDAAIIQWVQDYLTERDIHFWTFERGEYHQTRWSANQKFFINYDDLYGPDGEKRIARRFAHLPSAFALKIVHGLIDSDGSTSRGAEIVFHNTSLALVEGVRYQMLRLGVPTAGNERDRQNDHEFTRSDGSVGVMTGRTVSYDLRIPAVEELAQLVGVKTITKRNWLRVGNYVLTRVNSVQRIEPCDEVVDLIVEGMEEYATTAFLAHNGGKRKGAGCIYLETWHLDIEDFIELRKDTGDERRRAHDTNLANWIPDEFFLRVLKDQDWYLFSPSDCPDLHDLVGEAFSARYAEYIEKAKAGEIKNHRVVKAKALWKQMIDLLFETGQGWVTMKDPSNLRYTDQHLGVIHSSNLCTEILRHTIASMYQDGAITKVGETAVCNLGSLNVPAFFKTYYDSTGPCRRVLDWEKLRQVVPIAMQMLNNVIDLNYYPTEEARNSNMRHRPVGLGIMGFHDCLHEMGYTFESDEAKDFASELQEIVSYEAILASSKLAEKDGPYSTYKGSLWDQGKLPIDTYHDLMEYRVRLTGKARPEYVKPKLDWTPVRERVAKFGVRNSNMQAIAPTATISYIVGSSQSIEPDFSVLWVYSTLSGEFTMVNEYFVKRAKELGLWGPALADAIKRADGDVSLLDLPPALKTEFKNAFNVDQHKLIDCAAERQKWIDMGQSMNLYANHTSRKKLHEMYMHAWESGLKTTYYLRTIAASRVEKSTVDKADGKVYTAADKQACSINAAKTGEICEACQ